MPLIDNLLVDGPWILLQAGELCVGTSAWFTQFVEVVDVRSWRIRGGYSRVYFLHPPPPLPQTIDKAQSLIPFFKRQKILRVELSSDVGDRH